MSSPWTSKVAGRCTTARLRLIISLISTEAWHHPRQAPTFRPSQSQPHIDISLQVEMTAVRMPEIGSILKRDDGTYRVGCPIPEGLSTLQQSSSKLGPLKPSFLTQSSSSVRVWVVALSRRCCHPSRSSLASSKCSLVAFSPMAKGHPPSIILIYIRVTSLSMMRSKSLLSLTGVHALFLGSWWNFHCSSTESHGPWMRHSTMINMANQ